MRWGGKLRAEIGWIEDFTASGAPAGRLRPPPRVPALDAVVQALRGRARGALPVGA